MYLLIKIVFTVGMVSHLIGLNAWGEANYSDNGDGTIVQTAVSLMWQQSDDGVERVWDDAMTYCDELELAGYSDWQLPKIHMLEDLIEPGFSPTIDPVFKVRPSYYWSSSESRSSIKSAKYVNFFYGNTYAFSKDNTYYSICVRDISVTVSEPLKAEIRFEVPDKEKPFEVLFTSLVTGGSRPFFYEWDFGDGDFSSFSSPTHVYKEQGRYHVILTVSDNDGSLTVVRKEIGFTLDSMRAMAEPEVAEKIGEEVFSEDETFLPPAELASQELLFDSMAPGSAGVSSMVEEGNRGSTILEDGVLDTDLAMDEETISMEKPVSSDVETPAVVQDFLHENQAAVGDEKQEFVTASGAKAISKTELIPEEGGGDETNDLNSADVLREPDESQDSLAEVKVEGEMEEHGQAESSLSVKGQLRIFASKGEGAAPLVSRNQGFLAYAFSNGIAGDADWNKDGSVTAREIKGYLGIAIDNLSGGKQTADTVLEHEDFPLCADGGVTYILAVGVDSYREETTASMPYALESAQVVAQTVSETCKRWKKLVISGPNTTRNNIFRALVTMGRNVTSQDTFILYFAGISLKGESGLLLPTYDTLPNLRQLTSLGYDDLVAFVGNIPAAHTIMLFETGANGK